MPRYFRSDKSELIYKLLYNAYIPKEQRYVAVYLEIASHSLHNSKECNSSVFAMDWEEFLKLEEVT